MSTPSWLALVAVVWWAALLNPAHSHQRVAAGLLDGIDLPGVVTTADRHSSLQTNDRRRSDPARDGNPPAAAIAATTIEPALDPGVRIVTFTYLPAARPIRSPAQPRAPPANVSAHAD
ncbi:MAG: hypothetical protein SXG53_11615 [Pseudomonadota bacterium]|nr:hypothetical protein [Pseudomonadota bacterium]